MENIFRTLITSFAIQLIFFVVAVSYQTDKITDLAYGLTFVILALLLLFVNVSPSIPHYLLVIMVTIWGLRLAGFLFLRILKTGKDKRFDGIREHFLKFAGFWFFQALAIWIIMLPVTFVLSSKHTFGFIYSVIAGTAIWFLGFAIEAIADFQKFKFKNKGNDGFIHTGLWKYSRHPNYFGEILIWWGIFLFAIPYLKGIGWLSLIGPLFITYLLLKVTGIPPLEKAYNERYKNDKKYKEYKAKTSLLIPLPPRKK
jgi:steroid 5-alpha reductase family enzyme